MSSSVQPSTAPAPACTPRLQVSDVTVVDHSLMRRAVTGTIIGNTMEWYDVGVYGYLALTMGQVFLPTAASSVQILFSPGSSPPPMWPAHWAASCWEVWGIASDARRSWQPR